MRPPSIFSCFSQLFVLTFLVSWHHINQHLEYQGNGGQCRRGQYQNPGGREAGRKGGGRSVSVSATRCKCPLCPPALQPWALGDGFFRRLTWASRGLPLLPRPCFNSWLSPVINYSSVWPDLVSNNSSYFEMHGGALFGFSLLFADLRGNGSSVFCGETSISLQPPFPQLHITTLLVRFLNKAFC